MRVAYMLSCLALAASIALASPAGELETVLKQMDEAAAKFRNT